MYFQYIIFRAHTRLCSSTIQGANRSLRALTGKNCRVNAAVSWRFLSVFLLLIMGMYSSGASAQVTPSASDRITISLSQGVPNFVGDASLTDAAGALPQSNWWYENNQDFASFATTSYAEVAASAADTGPSSGSDLSVPNFSGGGDNQATTAAINLAQPNANAAPMGVYQHGLAGVSTLHYPGPNARQHLYRTSALR